VTPAARPRDVPGRLELQADACAHMGAPFYGTLLRSAAENHRAGGVVRDFFEARAPLGELSMIGVRFMGALHYRALAGAAPQLAAHFPSCGGDGNAEAAWRAACSVLRADADEIAAGVRVTPQTNEVARATPLLGGVLAVTAATGMPVRLFDVGSSAGLNARLDCYAYEGDGWRWGDPGSPLALRDQTLSGRPNHLDAALHVLERAACDLHPLDVANGADRLVLRSYVWADQLDRFRRLDRAIEACARAPLTVQAADMLAWVPQRARPVSGAATIVMHSVVLDHLAPNQRLSFAEVVRDAGARATPDAPFAWLRMEMEGAGTFATRVTLWPGEREMPIAESDGHGQKIVWRSGE